MSPKITTPPTMLFLCLAGDVREEIAQQIKEGKRPLNWRTPGHKDYEAWTRLLKLHPEEGVMITI